MGGRSRPIGGRRGNAEEVLDAVFDFAENLIAQQRAFAKQMLCAASSGQQAIAETPLAAATEASAESASAASTPQMPSAAAGAGGATPTPAP